MLKRIKDIIKKREKKKRGFTLVELLAVIVILAVIMVITIPTVLGNISNSKQKAFSTVGKTMQKYLEDNYKNCKLGNELIAKYDKELFNGDCSLNTENMQKLIKNSGYSTNDIARVDVTDDGRGNYGVYMYPGSTGKFSGVRNQLTNPIPNKPDLSTGLVPVKYDGSNWVITTYEDPDWFNYSNQKWANAVSLAEGISKIPGTVLKVPDGTSTESDVLAMFVWIPRFSYTIGCFDRNGDGEVNQNVTANPNNPSETTTECLGHKDKVDNASDLARKTPGAIDIRFISTDKIDRLDFEKNFPIYNYDNNKPESREPDYWYTHPAFWWDKNSDGNREAGEELSGIWVGKFETSVNPASSCYRSINNKITIAADKNNSAYTKCKADNLKNEGLSVVPRILPNVLALTVQNEYNQFETAKFFISKDIYGLIGDAHMMKNSEWGAVAYLSQSIYGKYGNESFEGKQKQIFKNNSGRLPVTVDDSGDEASGKDEVYWAGYTGRSLGEAAVDTSKHSGFVDEGSYHYDQHYYGTGASTTGNIYGVYDMVGGAQEYVMGYFTGTGFEFGEKINMETNQTTNYSGFTKEPETKYFDSYSVKRKIGEEDQSALYVRSGETIGYGMAETYYWYDDLGKELTLNQPWITRGGSARLSINAGIFYQFNVTGGYSRLYSFRTTLINDK